MDILDLATSVDVGWTLVAAALVFFMQAGFAMVETGFTRAKNAGNIIMKNLMDFSHRHADLLDPRLRHHVRCGTVRSSAALISSLTAYVGEGYDCDDADLPDRVLRDGRHHRFRLHGRAHQVLCILHLLDALFLRSSTRFPVTGSGAAAGSQSLASMISQAPRRYIWSAASQPLIGAAILGPRIGKYTKDGKARAIPGHSLTLGALGVLYPVVLLVRLQRRFYRCSVRRRRRGRIPCIRNHQHGGSCRYRTPLCASPGSATRSLTFR